MEYAESARGRRPKRRLVYVNRALIVLILAINTYVFVAPLLPNLTLWKREQETKKVAGLPYKTQLDANSKAATARQATPQDDRLVIPKIALDEHIYEGSSSHLVNLGVWARPKASTPPDGSNTVLVAHRFTYDGPATFYSLDKVVVGDAIVVYWQHQEYDYLVSETKVVPPTALDVEQPTAEPQLTLYTCTPLWSAKNRLVVVAKPITKGVSHE